MRTTDRYAKNCRRRERGRSVHYNASRIEQLQGISDKGLGYGVVDEECGLRRQRRGQQIDNEAETCCVGKIVRLRGVNLERTEYSTVQRTFKKKVPPKE
jgi:hypothetical protein